MKRHTERSVGSQCSIQRQKKWKTCFLAQNCEIGMLQNLEKNRLILEHICWSDAIEMYCIGVFSAESDMFGVSLIRTTTMNELQ